MQGRQGQQVTVTAFARALWVSTTDQRHSARLSLSQIGHTLSISLTANATIARENPMTNDYDLDNAYEIDGPASAKKLYGEWAETYDSSFGEGWGYIAPREIAAIYRAEMGGENTPLLDIGAGTGLVAEHLKDVTTDALDITPEMLEVAGTKGIYRNLITADLLKPLDIPDASYGGVISSGTFTHGHVGPDCLPELLRITKPGALFVCGCIPPVFDGMGFGSTLGLLNAQGAISALSFRNIPIYEGKDHPHKDDRGLVMVFRRA